MRFIDGSEFRITKAAAETNGDYLEMEWSLPPSTETPREAHPSPPARGLRGARGAFEVFVRDGWRTVAAGESASAPVGEVHTFRVGDRAVRVRNVHAPALDFEDYFAAESALMEVGKIRSYSSPGAPVTHLTRRWQCGLSHTELDDQRQHCLSPLHFNETSVLIVLSPAAPAFSNSGGSEVRLGPVSVR